MVVALALQNTPEPLGVPLRLALPGALVYQKGSPVDISHSLAFSSLSSFGDFEIGSHCSLRNLARPGPVPLDSWGVLFSYLQAAGYLPDCQVEVCPIEDLE